MKIFLVGGKHNGELKELIGHSITVDGELYTLNYLLLDNEKAAVYVCKDCANPLKEFLDEVSIWIE